MRKIIAVLKKVKRKLRQMLSVPRYVLHRVKIDITSVCYRKYPLQNKIVFANFNGRGFGCNPKYIAQELLRQQVPYDLVWLVNDMDAPMPAGIRKVPFHGRQSYYELATAKVIVNNVKGDLNLRKRKGQFYIQTWHAGFGFKLVEKNALSKLPKDYVIESKINSRDTDLMLAGSKFQSNEYRQAFWCKCEILEQGLPRNDAYFGKTEEELLEIKASLGLSAETKVALYAPTFRTGSDTLETYGLDLERTRNALQTHWGGNWVLLFRHHPNLKIPLSFAKDSNVINVSEYPDMQELVLITDVFISDYTSAMFEAAFLNKIIFVFATDVDEYEKSRGLNKAFYMLPYPMARNNDEMMQIIHNFDRESYDKTTGKFLEKFQPFETGNASKAVATRICSFIDDNK